jgi:hypothetical protein
MDGTDDDVQVQHILDAHIPSSGGAIVIYGGDWNFSENVTRHIDNVTIMGSGKSTHITHDNSTPIFDCHGQTGWIFKDMSVDSGAFYGTFGADNFREMCWISNSIVNDVPGGNITDAFVLSGDGLIYLSFRPAIDQVIIQNKIKPVMVYRGATRGFTMPIWNAVGNADEQIFATEPRVPSRWDGVSDIVVIITGYLDTANNAKRFGLEVGWQSVTPGVDVVGTSINTDNTQVLTGNWAQYESFSASVTLNYDVAPANPILVKDCMGLRIRRIAKEGIGDEITGNVIITGIDMRYRCDKFGAST